MSSMAENIVKALMQEGWIVSDNFEYSTKELEANITSTIDDVLGLQDDLPCDNLSCFETDDERSERITKELNAEE